MVAISRALSRVDDSIWSPKNLNTTIIKDKEKEFLTTPLVTPLAWSNKPSFFSQLKESFYKAKPVDSIKIGFFLGAHAIERVFYNKVDQKSNLTDKSVKILDELGARKIEDSSRKNTILQETKTFKRQSVKALAVFVGTISGIITPIITAIGHIATYVLGATVYIPALLCVGVYRVLKPKVEVKACLRSLRRLWSPSEHFYTINGRIASSFVKMQFFSSSVQQKGKTKKKF